mgnify:CR=1 FL=1
MITDVFRRCTSENITKNEVLATSGSQKPLVEGLGASLVPGEGPEGPQRRPKLHFALFLSAIWRLFWSWALPRFSCSLIWNSCLTSFAILGLKVMGTVAGRPKASGYAAPVLALACWRDKFLCWLVPNHPYPGVPLPATVPPKNQLFFDSVSDPTFSGKWCQMGAPWGSQNPQKSVKISKSAPQSALWEGTLSRPWKNMENWWF